jgi:hypothetical protein
MVVMCGDSYEGWWLMVSWRMLFPRDLVGIVSVREEKNNRMFPLCDNLL